MSGDFNDYFKLRNVDPSFYQNAQLASWIKNELKPTDRILDYGCGFGQTLRALKENGFEKSYGVDIEPAALQHAQESGLTVKALNLTKLANPFPHTFEAIIISHVIEHIPKEQIIKTLIAIREKFLSPSGKLLVAVPNAQSNTDCYWRYEDWTHTTLFTAGSLNYVLKAAGFDKVTFLDVDCTAGFGTIKKILRRLLLKLYIYHKHFWNKVTSSSYHLPSPAIYSFEIKARAVASKSL